MPRLLPLPKSAGKRPSRSPGRSQPRYRTCLSVEVLEDRVVLDTHSWIGPQFNGLWSTNANWVDTTPGPNQGMHLAPGQPGETNIVVQFQGSVVSFMDITGLAVDEVIFSSNGNRILDHGNGPLKITNNLLTSILDTSGSSAFDIPVVLSPGNINVSIPPATGTVSFNNTVTSAGASSTLVETAGSAGTLQIGSDSGLPAPSPAAVNGAVNNNVQIIIQSGELLLNQAAATNTAVGTGLITLGTGAGGSSPSALLKFGNDFQMNTGANVQVDNDGQILFDDNFEEELGNMTLHGNSAFATVALTGNQQSNDRQIMAGFLPILAVSSSVTADNGATIVPGQASSNPFGYLAVAGNPTTFTVTDNMVNNQNVPGLTVTAKIVNRLFTPLLPDFPNSSIVVTAPMNMTGTMVTTAANTFQNLPAPFTGFLSATTTIDTGATLQVDNAVLFHPIPLDMANIVLNGGTLTGVGYVGNVTTTALGGTVSPGDSGGVGQIATLHVGVYANVVTGDNAIPADLDFRGTGGVTSVNYLVDFTGSNPGQFDQILVNGNVHLGPVLAGPPATGGTNVVVHPTANLPINVTVPIIQAAPGSSTPDGSFLQGILPFFDSLMVNGQTVDEKFSVAVNAVNTGTFTGNNATVARISANTTTAVTSSSPQVAGVPTSPVGTPVTFTATVTPETTPGNIPILGAPPTGTIVFNIDGNNQPPVNLVNGAATFTFTFTTVAMHTVAAQYVPTPPLASNPFVGSVGSLPIQNVIKVPAVITYTPTANPQNFGSPLSFTITVNSGGATPVAGTGNILYGIDAAPSIMAPLNASGTTASIPANGLSVGPHTIQVSYAGDANLLPPTMNPMSFTQTILPAASQTVVTSSRNPSPFGATVTFTATVSPVVPQPGTPAGTVTFNIDGTLVAGVPLVGGVATFTTSTLTGTGSPHSVVVNFTDTDGLFANSSGSLAGGEVITPGAIATITVSVPPATQFGAPATITATVTSPMPPLPTGTVQFFAGSTLIGTAPLRVVNGQAVASLTTSTLPAGANPITAVYLGDANYGSVGSLVTSTLNGTVPSMNVPPVILTINANPVVVGAGTGFAPFVQVYDSGTRSFRFTLLPFPVSFTGGVRVATGDINGDGVPDIICAAGPGGGPQVVVYNGKTGAPLAIPNLGNSFYGISPGTFTGGLYVAAGDVNGDGFADIIVGADAGGGPQVDVFSGKDGSLLTAFNAFPSFFTGGVRVGAGDINGDGKADIIVGAGPGALPEIKAFSGAGTGILLDTFAFPTSFAGGVFVAGGDVEGTGKAQVIVGAGGVVGAPQVLVFDVQVNQAVASFNAFGAQLPGGVRVGAVNALPGGRAALIAGAGPGGRPQVSLIDATNLATLDSFFALDSLFSGGVYVA